MPTRDLSEAEGPVPSNESMIWGSQFPFREQVNANEIFHRTYPFQHLNLEQTCQHVIEGLLVTASPGTAVTYDEARKALEVEHARHKHLLSSTDPIALLTDVQLGIVLSIVWRRMKETTSPA